MKRVIHKYALTTGNINLLDTGRSPVVRHIGYQNNAGAMGPVLMAWVEEDAQSLGEGMLELLVVATGEEFAEPQLSGAIYGGHLSPKYLGTAVRPDGLRVWHIFLKASSAVTAVVS